MKQVKLPTLSLKQAERVRKYAETDLFMGHKQFFISLPVFRAYESLTELPTSEISQSNFMGAQRPRSSFHIIEDYKIPNKRLECAMSIHNDTEAHKSVMLQLMKEARSLTNKK